MKTILLILIAAFSHSVLALEMQPDHEMPSDQCIAPQRPIDDSDDGLWQSFLTQVDTFRECINSQVEWHQQAADEHYAGASSSVDRWNNFVRSSLNAPEDFPWPPEDS